MVRAHLDRNGYSDVKLTLIGDVPWSKMRYDTDIANALRTTVPSEVSSSNCSPRRC
jgi:hypothetical protein